MAAKIWGAFTDGNIQAIQNCIRDDPSVVNAVNSSGSPIVVEAARLGVTEVLKLLLQHGANVNAANKKRETAITWATVEGNIATFDALIAHGADVNHAEEKGFTPIISASKRGFTPIVKYLISKNADLNKITANGETALIWATVGGHENVVRLLCENGADVNICDSNGYHPLISAAKRGFDEIMLIILNHGPLINKPNKSKETALIRTIIDSKLSSFRILLEHGAHLDVRDKSNNTPFILACKTGEMEMVEALIDKGVDVNAVNMDSQTGLVVAVRNRKESLVEFILQRKGPAAAGASTSSVDINRADEGGLTALMHAAELGLVRTVQLLIEVGALTTVVDKKGKKARDLTKKQDVIMHFDLVEDPEGFIQKYGGSALSWAVRSGYTALVLRMLENGANPNALDEKGYCALSFASNETVALHLLDANSIVDTLTGKDNISIIISAHKQNWSTFVARALLKFPFFEQSAQATSSTSAPNFTPRATDVWIYITTETKDAYVEQLCTILDNHIEHLDVLCDVRDASGRRCLDVATPRYKQAMMERSFLLQRYELRDGPAEHVSATCIVRLAVDHGDNKNKVALKFIHNRDHFEREVSVRASAMLDSLYVLNTLRVHDGDVDQKFRQEVEKKALYSYCLVMPAAERNLGAILAHEHIAGRDWDQLRLITKQLISAVGHMHQHGYIHGDVKPLNAVRSQGVYRLIDLDASVRIPPRGGVTAQSGSGRTVTGPGPVYFVGAKYSSGYIPPEMVEVVEGANIPLIRTYETDVTTGELRHSPEYALLEADPSFDMWSLGMTLYQLYTGETFFLMNDEGNIDEKQLIALKTWSTEFRNDRLGRVRNNTVAKNLLERLLSFEPNKRPDTDRALAHPFVSGKKGSRMVGEVPEYDVFISYRVASDAHHAQYLYSILTKEMGLKVWWDKVCLKPGVRWEDGFCDGLISSRTFLPILSKNGVKHPTITRQNFEALTVDSPCDNCLLEYRLALELEEFGLIERIFPVLIGEEVSTSTYSSYFRDGSHPSNCPQTHVNAVELKLVEHLDRQGLGSPTNVNETVKSVVDRLLAHQGGFVVGNGSESFGRVAAAVQSMLADMKAPQDGVAVGASVAALPDNSRPSKLVGGAAVGGDGIRAVLAAKDVQINKLNVNLSRLLELLQEAKIPIPEDFLLS